MAIPQVVIEWCVCYRNDGFTWPQIADKITQLGFYQPNNGKPYHNAALASATVNSPKGRHLRQRNYNSRVQQHPTKVGRPHGSVSYKKKIAALESVGFSPSAILAALKAN